jgi:hypothetical protein
MEHVSIFTTALFILTTVITVWQFSGATSKPLITLLIIGLLMGLQAVLGIKGFYTHNNSLPPGFLFLIGPSMLFILVLFILPRTRRWTETLDMGKLTILHAIRIPVEIILYYVCLAGYIRELMTFEGRNFDILSGISAPVVYYLCFVARRAGRTVLLVWNIACLLLLLNILTIALLSLQTPFQKLAFEQPNIAVTYFPFVWLPGIIVPIVLFSHLVSIRRLLLGEKLTIEEGRLTKVKL